jgi:hypothetical protein
MVSTTTLLQYQFRTMTVKTIWLFVAALALILIEELYNNVKVFEGAQPLARGKQGKSRPGLARFDSASSYTTSSRRLRQFILRQISKDPASR